MKKNKGIIIFNWVNICLALFGSFASLTNGFFLDSFLLFISAVIVFFATFTYSKKVSWSIFFLVTIYIWEVVESLFDFELFTFIAIFFNYGLSLGGFTLNLNVMCLLLLGLTLKSSEKKEKKHK